MELKKSLDERIDELIQHYQKEADELKQAVERSCGSDATVSVYKAMHSLWRTCCNFVADLDELATHCEIADFAENCEECGFCNKNKKGEINMIIKKYAESNMDESCFYGKIEVETDTKSEWENVIRILQTIQDDCLACHCNLKENAEMVAIILDHDVVNQVCPLGALSDGK